MFIYEFKSPSSSLITKIVISGSYLTFYTSKALNQELNPLIKAFGLKWIRYAEDPAHLYCHHPYIEFSALGDAIPHKHVVLPAGVNRVNYLRELLNFLIHRQHNALLREQDYHTFVAALEAERASYGDAVFPAKVQKAIDEYDTQSIFISEEEADILLHLFEDYTYNPYYIKLEALNSHTETVLKNNRKTIYRGSILNFGDTVLTAEEKTLCAYYEDLLALRENLLAIDRFPYNVSLYYQAKNLLSALIQTRHSSADNDFRPVIDYFQKRIHQKLALIERIEIGFTASMALTASAGYFYCRQPSLFTGEILGASVVIGIISVFLHKHVTLPLSNQFFLKENKKEKEEDPPTPPPVTKFTYEN